ncbi:protein-tyrosine-phosphatase [Balneolaceae bacterium ANBcel3]|nr:protein-tyrosine-phosphatase [Balneolaceae bacterium ANBcel3]
MARMTPVIDQLIDQLLEEKHLIAPSRIEILDTMAEYIRKRSKSKRNTNLVYICTHNSRRSQIAQIWSHTASVAFQFHGCTSLSGGTEVTAFFPSAIQAMKTLGFSIESSSGSSPNPVYDVHVGEQTPSISCYSKKYEDAVKSIDDFAAIMTCSDADVHCPVIPGAEKRIPLTYNDPKHFDETDQQKSAYLKTAVHIGREILYVFNKAL